MGVVILPRGELTRRGGIVQRFDRRAKQHDEREDAQRGADGHAEAVDAGHDEAEGPRTLPGEAAAGEDGEDAADPAEQEERAAERDEEPAHELRRRRWG